MTEPQHLMARMDDLLKELRRLTVEALSARFRCQLTQGLDWSRMADVVADQLGWPFTPEEWGSAVEDVAQRVDRWVICADEDDDEWFTADHRAYLDRVRAGEKPC